MLRLLQIALTIMLVAVPSVHAQRAGSGRHVGVSSHASPSFSSATRNFASPARSTMQRGPGASTQNRRHPQYERRGGVGYHTRYPYFYAGYPGLLSFGYGMDSEENTPQVNPASGDEPPVDNSAEVAAGNAPMFRPAYQPQGPPAAVQPATMLVFRDGRAPMEVHNYALTGQTLYALDDEKRMEIPLSQLDLPATAEVNRKSGVDFALPTHH